MISKNWLFWVALFFAGAIFLFWLEWQAAWSSNMMGFIAISLWSAVCAIGYTIIEWAVKK